MCTTGPRSPVINLWTGPRDQVKNLRFNRNVSFKVCKPSIFNMVTGPRP